MYKVACHVHVLDAKNYIQVHVYDGILNLGLICACYCVKEAIFYLINLATLVGSLDILTSCGLSRYNNRIVE